MGVNFPVQYTRINRQPLTDQEVFLTYGDANTYATAGASYPGQLVAVRTADVPDLYVISETRLLHKIGSGSGGGIEYKGGTQSEPIIITDLTPYTMYYLEGWAQSKAASTHQIELATTNAAAGYIAYMVANRASTIVISGLNGTGLYAYTFDTVGDEAPVEQIIDLTKVNQIDNKVDKELKTGSTTEYKVLSDNNFSDTDVETLANKVDKELVDPLILDRYKVLSDNNLSDELKAKYDAAADKALHDKGTYATPEALRAAYPTAIVGDYARVTSTSTFWEWSGNDSDWVDSGRSIADVGTDDVLFSQTITVSGIGTVGGYSDGDIITLDQTNVTQAFQKLLQKQVPPTYNNPTLGLAIQAPTSVEIGAMVTAIVVPTWNQNDAGTITSYRLSEDSIAIFTNPTAATYTSSEFQASANVVYRASAEYGEGPIKNDNFGNPYPAGHIAAGTVQSSNATLSVYRKGFYGTSSAASPSVPATSDAVRNLGSAVNNPQKNTTIALNISIGTTFACFAYPASLGAVQSVISQKTSLDFQSAFTRTEVLVAGANNFNPVSYYVYTLIPDLAYTDSDVYTVKI